MCSRLGFTIPRPLYDGASKAQPLAIERILSCVKAKIVELGEQGGLQALVRGPYTALHSRSLRGDLDQMTRARPFCSTMRTATPSQMLV